MKRAGVFSVLEHKSQPIVPLGVFLLRILRSLALVSLVVAAALSVGVLGYHFIEGIAWVDAFLNAAMILGGMGPVAELHSTTGKIFAGCYALFSGLVFILVAGLFFAPILHRFLHRFHMEGRRD